MNPKLDVYFRNLKKWREEFGELRTAVLACGLDETVKWRWPCYTLGEKNIVLIHGFKDYCALLFFKGALLKDPKGILKAPGSMQAGRQMRFTQAQEIAKLGPVIKTYVREAVAAEKAGLKVLLKKTAEFAVPIEFQKKLDAIPALKTAFAALTPGRQRVYLFHFSQAKQSATRESRVEKCMPQILGGKGLND